MILRRLFGESCDFFLERCYLTAPFARPAGCREYAEKLEQSSLLHVFDYDGLDVIVGRDGKPWHDVSPPTCLRDATGILKRGGTLCVRNVERHSSSVAELANEFRGDLRAPVDVHLHWTPPTKSGFGWHYDAEDVFVLQTDGSKEWWLRKNTVNPWPLLEMLPLDMHYERESMPAMRCLLAPGDVLYVPHGYWHRTEARETSLSLSVGLRCATALDLLSFVRERLTESLRWRQRLPFRGEGCEAGDLKWQVMCDGLCHDIERALSDRHLIEDFIMRWADADDAATKNIQHGTASVVSSHTRLERNDPSKSLSLFA